MMEVFDYRVESVLFMTTQNHNRSLALVVSCVSPTIIANCSEILRPLTELPRKSSPKFFMTPEAK